MTCVVSIDYLTKPVEILSEVRRVLRPGGKVILSQSNRMFMTKAVRMWVSMGDQDHLELIGQYFFRAELPLMNRGDAAAATRIVWRPVAATPRPRRG